MLSRRYFKVAMSRSIRSLETISRPYRHFVFVFRVSVPLRSSTRANVSLLPASSFLSHFLSPSFVLQEQDSCRPPISRTRISPLRIFNFNIFLHRAAFTSRYIITALLLFPFWKSERNPGKEFARSEVISFLNIGPLENRWEDNIIFNDVYRVDISYMPRIFRVIEFNPTMGQANSK